MARKAKEEEVKKGKGGKSKVEAKPTKTAKKKAEEKPAAKSKKKGKEEPEPKKKRGRKEEPEVKTKTKGSKTKTAKKGEDAEDDEIKFFNPLENLDDDLDAIEKDYSLSGASLGEGETRTSTGFLEIDTIIGGGILPGWYTFFGGEQSCKSTGANTIMAAALHSEVAAISMWDYEGSTSHEYLRNIMRTNSMKMALDNVFGIRDPRTNSWIVKPRVRYYSEAVAEKFFDYIAKLERTLPDKMKIGNEWYYVYESKNNEGKTHKRNTAIVGSRYDKDYYKKTGKYRIRAKDGSLQALAILDSLPAMLPERQDVDDPGSGMASQARMFSEQIKRVKGKMRAKRIAIIAVNQVRKAPAVMFGNPEYEPCGEAPKFFSDVRLRMSGHVLNAAPGMTEKGQILEEKSVTGKGVDTYRMIKIRAHKNKLSVPNLEGWLRLWIEDGNGDARGFDPVWDTWRYLINSGQCKGARNKIKITIKGHEAKSAMTWMQFKMAILGNPKQQKAVYEDVGLKPFDIRAWCKKDLHEGKGFLKILETKRSGNEDDEEAVTEVAGDDEE